jgi:hypothetical protein
LPTVDSAPESLPHNPTVNVVPQEETDSLRAIAKFPARTSQPFSPSSGSDVDVSGVDSEADTLAAVTPNNPSNEVDVDLINQFERLMLSKQVQSKNSPATPTLNTTFPLSEEESTPVVAVNETVSSSIHEEEDILPADATRDVLSVTRDVSTTNQDDSEFASFLDQPEHSSFADLKAHSRAKNFICDPDNSSSIVEDQKHQVIDEEDEEVESYKEELVPAVEEEAIVSSVVEIDRVLGDKEIVPTAEETVPVAEEQPVPVVEQETVPSTEEEIVPAVEKEIVSGEIASDLKEEIVPVVEEAVSVDVEKELGCAVDEETVPVVKKDNISVVEETVPLLESEIISVTEGEPVLVVEKDSVPVEEEQSVSIVEKEAVSDNKEPVVIQEFNVTTNKEELIPSVEEQPTATIEQAETLESVDISSSEVDTVPVEGDSTFSSTAEQTVLNVADKSCPAEVCEATGEESQTSTVTVDDSPELPLQDTETTAVKPTSLPEEKPIVPKKGYDLSFLDRFDDLENATPSISQAKLLPQLSTPITNLPASTGN